MSSLDIAILGTGKYALAILHLLSYNINKVTVIGRDDVQLEELETYSTNKKYSNKTINLKINTKNLDKYDLSKFNEGFYCLPVSCLETHLNTYIKRDWTTPIIYTCKGVSVEFLCDWYPHPYVLMMGPSYAHEILNGNITSLTIASSNKTLIKLINNILDSLQLRLYYTNDVVSIEMLGIFKNIASIGCGMIEELGMGKNAIAAWIVRVICSIKNYKSSFDPASLIQPAGLGDIYLTCSSTQSRNYCYGVNLIKGNINQNKTVEGLNSLKVLKKKNIKDVIYKFASLFENINNYNNKEKIK